MATVTVEISEGLKKRAEAKAIEAGFSNLNEFVTQLIIEEAAEVPEHLIVNSDEDLLRIALERADDPGIVMDAADFRQMREKFLRMLEEQKKKG